jgi:hypothetical protein
MATSNPTPSTSTTGFTPFFKRVSQREDRHADIFACIATLTNKSLTDIQAQAQTLGLPSIGPYHAYITEDLIAKLLVTHGLVATVWKECTDWNEISDVSIVMVDYDPELEIGRCVVFHRQKSADNKTTTPYVVDPYLHTDTKLHLRLGTAELATLAPAWYIGVHPAAAK